MNLLPWATLTLYLWARDQRQLIFFSSFRRPAVITG